MPTIIPMLRFGLPKPPGHGYLHTADSDLMHHQYRLSVLQWNPGPARRNPTQIIAATCGRFHAVTQQKASDHVPQVSDQFVAYTSGTDLAILLLRDTSSPTLVVMAALVVRGLPWSLSSVHIHNVVAKKRDASTDLLRRLHAHMTQHEVDFIGGDFNKSAFSTVGGVRRRRVFGPW